LRICCRSSGHRHPPRFWPSFSRPCALNPRRAAGAVSPSGSQSLPV
jgi:hypothetical protein